jgi:hypothetical protein
VDNTEQKSEQPAKAPVTPYNPSVVGVSEAKKPETPEKPESN